MARKLITSLRPVKNSSRDRVVLSGNIIGVIIKNSGDSNGNLLVGVNSEDATEKVLPGVDFPLGGYASGDPYYMDGTFVVMEWDSAATEKSASLLIYKDGGAIDEC